MSSYVVVKGDTFENISRKVYGIETLASDIIAANPGASEPLAAGTSLIIPNNPNAIVNKNQGTNPNNEDEVILLIDGNQFVSFTSIEISKSLDGIDTLDITSPFEPGLKSFRDTFIPFSYKEVILYIGSEVFFTGTVVNIMPSVGATEKTVQISAYAKAGVLNDCTAPASLYPIEYNQQNLQDISNSLLKPFGLKSVFDADIGGTFDRVALEPGQKILEFLANLAKQRGLVIGNDADGNLLYRKSNINNVPVAFLRLGEEPVTSIVPNFNPQEYYSHITGIEPIVIGLAGGTYTVKNPFVTNLLRPFTFEVTDAEAGTLKEAVEAKAGRMFGNMMSYDITVNTWRDNFSNIWSPNTIVNLQADNAMLYNDYDFIIRSIKFNKDNRTKTASMNLVLPGSFSGAIPESLPWE